MLLISLRHLRLLSELIILGRRHGEHLNRIKTPSAVVLHKFKQADAN
jgi:hypothetical protein